MFVTLSFLVCIAGLLLYGFASNSKVSTVGQIMFAHGLLAFLLTGYVWFANNPAFLHIGR